MAIKATLFMNWWTQKLYLVDTVRHGGYNTYIMIYTLNTANCQQEEIKTNGLYSLVRAFSMFSLDCSDVT